MASGRFFGSAYDGVDDGEFADGEGTLADAVENRSGVVDRVRPLPTRRSCRSWLSAARVRRCDAVQRDSETSFRVLCANVMVMESAKDGARYETPANSRWRLSSMGLLRLRCLSVCCDWAVLSRLNRHMSIRHI